MTIFFGSRGENRTIPVSKFQRQIYHSIVILMGICKTRTGWLRMADADGGWENADGKIKKLKLKKIIKNKIKGINK